MKMNEDITARPDFPAKRDQVNMPIIYRAKRIYSTAEVMFEFVKVE